jgi:hypothetical protein
MRWLVVAVIFLAVFGIFTTVYAIAARPNEVRVLPKWVWVFMCAALPLVGGLLYLTLGRPLAPGTGTTGTAGRGRQTRVVAPDDDPNFLRDLNRRLNKDNKPADESAAADGAAADSAAADSAAAAETSEPDSSDDESGDAGSGDGGKPSAT